MLSPELWADIKGCEGYYQITQSGKIRSLPRIRRMSNRNTFYPMKILKQSISSNGYFIVSIWMNGVKKTFPVHRLIAETFIGNPDNKSQVNHKNGIKADNRIENLEWVSQSENAIHAIKSGLRKY